MNFEFPSGDALVPQSGIRREMLPLPTGVRLSLRSAGPPGAPCVLLLHGFPQAAFVWDETLLWLAGQGYHAVAPNLRGYEHSSAPKEVSAYRAKHLVQDIALLVGIVSPDHALHALVAHDWGGAVAWNLANQQPQLMQRLCILNSPHPGPFLRALRSDPAQQAASGYMNFLAEPGAAEKLAAKDFEMVWRFMTGKGGTAPAWLTPQLKAQHEAAWRLGLQGGCNYYRASPLRTPTASDPGAAAISLPPEMLQIKVPTRVLWGMGDTALLPCLLDGLESHIPDLQITRLAHATHWVLHEDRAAVHGWLGASL